MGPCPSAIYKIRIKGHLGGQWAGWFEGLTVTLEDNGDTLLSGPVVDQAALHGLLKKVRDLGLPLISVNCDEPDPAGGTSGTGREESVSQAAGIRLQKKGEAMNSKMKAIVYTQYGSPDVLQLKEVEIPVLKDNDVLVKVHAASANPLDWHYLRGTPFVARFSMGLRKPKNSRLGVDVAGRVEAVGKNVTEFQPGDAVFGHSYLGSFAEFARAPEDNLVLKPDGLSFNEAASVAVAAITALQSLRDFGHLQPGQKVLINGASGGVGTFCVQIAKALGAQVTGVCSTRNLELVRSIGADQVIDYTQEDFTKNGQRYDLIVDNVGNRTVFDMNRALSPGGYCVVVGFTSLANLFLTMAAGPLLSKTGSKKLGMMDMANVNKKDLVFLKELLEAGKIVPVIDKCYPLNEAAEAIRYLEEGHARAKVILTVA